MDTTAAAPEAPILAPAPLMERLRDTFIAPRKLFSRFDARPPWVDALGLATLIAAVAMAAEPAEFYLDQMENPVNRRGVHVEITSPPEQIVLWGRVMAVLSAIVGHPMLAFAAAGLLLLAFGILGRGGGSFRQYLAVASHGMLIASVGMLLTNLLRMALGAPGFLPTVGMLSGLPETGVFGATLHGINLFTLWTLAVLGVGSAAVASRVTAGAATSFLWGGYGLLAVTTALLFSG